LFDLPEDRLDDGLAPRIDGLARPGHEFSFHSLDQRGRLRNPSTRALLRDLIVFLFACGYE
jgi:hypothetical protein